MSGRPFRFIHASDLHLERVPRGLAAVPDHLRDLLVDAAYLAATKVFDAALAEEADFLILAGDVLHPRSAGPRGIVFLVEQFRRLAQRGIGVYWAAGRVDRADGWPNTVPLPDNVCLFSPGRVEEFVVRRDGIPLARVLGASQDGRTRIRAVDFPAQHTQLYSIGVAHGAADPDRLSHRAVHFWALGGRHERTTLSVAPHIVHYPGTPQGRSPEEPGPHGCTLVQVDEQGRARLTSLPADAVRWHEEQVMLPDDATPETLLAQLRQQIEAAQAGSPGVNLLITWRVVSAGPLMTRLRRGGLAAELIATLQKQYGQASPTAWTVSLDTEPTQPEPAAYDQETILGDFLRAVRRFQSHADLPLDFEPFLSERQLAGSLGAAARFADPALRDRALREATCLGSDLLSPDESPPARATTTTIALRSEGSAP